jgi:threonine/homoserine/homoserine lactone efflux protein
MHWQEFLALLTLATATSFTPGPNTTLSTALAANFGLKRALRFVLAVPVGWGLLLTACAAGLGAVIVAIPLLRTAIKVIGIGYLLWLAFRLSRSTQLGSADSARMNLTFWQGVLLQFVNIKAWMLALTVVAGWIAGTSDAVQRFALVLPVMLCFGLASNFTYALTGSLLREWLATGNRLLVFNRLMATLLVATSIWMMGV